jgi:ABC-type glycerol-3-phosphate transport system substrate-binding protein
MKLKMIAATALVTVAGAFGASAAQADGTPTKVTIKGQEGDYYGYVKSADDYCESDRTVKVYKMEGSKPKPKQDLLIGTDTSAPNGPDGMWSIGNSGYKDGHFYAKVKKNDTCGADLSKVIVR